MDAKLNHSEISALFAKATGLSQSEADSFSKAFFDLIIDGLESDGIVKINGLGTFKVVGVDSRESVNVSTGERIEIKGHKKLSFTPAESLKDTINAPFAMFEPVEVNEDIDDEEQVTESDDASAFDEEPIEELAAEQSEESVVVAPSFPAEEIEEEMPAEDTASPVDDYRNCIIDEEMPVEEVVEQPVTDSSVQEQANESAVTETIVVEECEPVAAEVASVEEAPVEENETEDAPVVCEPKQEQAKHGKSEIDLNAVKAPENFLANNVRPKKRKGYKYVAFLLLILVAAVGVIVFALNDSSSPGVVSDDVVVAVAPEKAADGKKDTIISASDTVAVPVVNDTVPAVNTVKEDEPFVVIEALANRPLSQITVGDTTDYAASGVMTEHVVALEETLIKISLKHYGDKKLWPYIVQYNNMERPNDLACGMVLKIPRLVPKK